MQDPLKQGLKLSSELPAVLTLQIRMQDPLKQGLKLCRKDSFRNGEHIRMQDPLKQGLKPISPSPIGPVVTEFECKIH